MSQVWRLADFLEELENFRIEQESAQQYFLAYLSLQWIPGDNDRVLTQLNDNPTFWLTARYSLLMSAFVTIGRIFDQDHRSVHNIDRLLRSVLENTPMLSQDGLRQRRIAEGMAAAAASTYASTKHDLTAEDVRDIRKQVNHWRRIYEDRYRDIRHLVFAHRGVKRIEVDDLMARAKIDEMLGLLAFLDGLNESLWQLYHNGTRPKIESCPFKFPPFSDTSPERSGERVYRQAMNVMFEMLEVHETPHSD